MDLIKIGVVGMGRGGAFLNSHEELGYAVKAICDIREDKLQKRREQFNLDSSVKSFTNFDEMLESDVGAVILCNYFDEHTPLAIKALQAGKHVMSECTSNATLAEGVALCRAVEASGKIYMLAENYPFAKNMMELSRMVHAGELGVPIYGEGEYNHPMDAETSNAISPGLYHWRNNIPCTYYCTHAMAPLMMATDTMPKKISGFAMANADLVKERARRTDIASITMCQMDNGALFKLLTGGLPGHSGYYRIHGTLGAAEIERASGRMHVWYPEWDIPKGKHVDSSYHPDWPEFGNLANAAGHGGGDFWTTYLFTRAIMTGTQPYLDVYRSVAMSSVGILAWKSVLQNGATFDMPDFSDEQSRKKYENDHWNPILKEGMDKTKIPPSSIIGHEPTAEDIAQAKAIWEKTNYFGLF